MLFAVLGLSCGGGSPSEFQDESLEHQPTAHSSDALLPGGVNDANGAYLATEDWTPTTNWAPSSAPASLAPRVRTGDFNGDGRTDVARFETGTLAPVFVGLAAEPKFRAGSAWTNWFMPDNSIQVLTGDFNGDLKSDIVKFDNGHPAGVWVRTSNGSGFDPWQSWDTVWMDPTIHVLTGDFNADSRTDFVKLDNGNSAGIWVRLSSGAKFESSSYWALWNGDTNTQVLVGDFNRDRRTDLAWFENAPSRRIMVAISTGTTFVVSSWGSWPVGAQPISADSHISSGDFDGDGRTDLVKFDTGRPGKVWVGLSNGTNGFSFNGWADWWIDVGTPVVVGDFDGDLKADILKTDVGQDAGIWVGYARSGSFETHLWETWDFDSSAHVVTGDVNGDGSTDAIRVNADATLAVRFGLAPCPQPPAPYLFQAGRRYALCYSSAQDAASVNTVWSGDALKTSLLQPMTRPVIVKADDLAAFDWKTQSFGIGSGWVRYMNLLASLKLAGTAGVIARGMEYQPQVATLNCLRSLNQNQMELWNHGYDHCGDNAPMPFDSEGWGCPTTPVDPGQEMVEFFNTSSAFQAAELTRAQNTVRNALGLTMRTFGPPHNVVDVRTASALAMAPEIRVSYYGLVAGTGAVNLTLNDAVQAEVYSDFFHVTPFSTYVAAYRAQCMDLARTANPALCPTGTEGPFSLLTVQLHPQGAYDTTDWDTLARLLNFLAADKRGFVTPQNYASWLSARNALRLQKTGTRSYLLDMRAVTRSMPLSFSVPPTSIRDLSTSTGCP